MSKPEEFDLLVDLAKLLKKYGPDTFNNLATHLNNADFTKSLAEILEKTAKTASTTKDNSVQPARREFRASLLAQTEIEPEKGALLIHLYDGLMSKTFLPTLRDLQAFAADTGISLPKITSRDKAVVPLVKAVASMSLQDAEKHISHLKPALNSQDRTLEGWSNIILGRSKND